MLFSTHMGEAAQPEGTPSTPGIRSRLASLAAHISPPSPTLIFTAPKFPPPHHFQTIRIASTPFTPPSHSRPSTALFLLNAVPRRALVSEQRHHAR
ncbi:hypothetical protein B0H12DRAFT_1116990, partial [Mycena haematopus]